MSIELPENYASAGTKQSKVDKIRMVGWGLTVVSVAGIMPGLTTYF